MPIAFPNRSRIPNSPGPTSLTAEKAPEGYVFDTWLTGGITLDTPNADELTLTMPEGAISLKPSYKPAPIEEEPTDTPTTTDPTPNEGEGDDGGNTVLIVVIVVSSLITAAGATVFFIFKKK